MKTLSKFIIALLCFQLLATLGYAQKAKRKTFTGIWELIQAGESGGQLGRSPAGYIKVFNRDGTFANLQARYSGSVISHSGKYIIKGGNEYIEVPTYRMPGMTGGPLGKGFKLNYEFSEDKKQLTLNFTLESGLALTEVWRRL